MPVQKVFPEPRLIGLHQSPGMRDRVGYITHRQYINLWRDQGAEESVQERVRSDRSTGVCCSYLHDTELEDTEKKEDKSCKSEGNQ